MSNFVVRLLRRRNVLVGLLVALASTTHSQPVPVSLQQAIDLALLRNPVVAVADLDVRQSESRLRELESTRYPRLSLRSHYLYTPATGYNEVVTNGGEYGLQVGASVPLYDGGNRGATIHEASNGIDHSRLGLEKSKSDLMFDVRTSYYELARALDEVRIREETTQRLEDYVSFLTRMQLGGNASSSDVLKAQVELNEARSDFESARQAVRKDEMALNKVVGNPVEQEITVSRISSADTSTIPLFAVEENFSLRMLQHDAISANDELNIARSERLPILEFAGDAGFLGVEPGEYKNNLGFSVFLALELPLFSWGGIENRIEQKEISRQQIDKQIELQRRDLETQWRTALSDIAYDRHALGSYAANIDNAEKNYLLAKSRFAGGSGSNLDVLDAERLLVQAKLKYNDTFFALNTSLATALKLCGR
jgi:outer membrane protein TolC